MPAQRDVFSGLYGELTAKTGSSYLVEWNISPVRDAQGQVQAYVSVQQDITKRVRAEQRQALLARALNATQDAVVIADAQAQILFVNQAFEDLTGYRSDEVLDVRPNFCNRANAPRFSTANCAMPWHAATAAETTFANRRKDGSIYHAAQTITPLRDEAGTTQHYVSVTKDVTELDSAHPRAARAGPPRCADRPAQPPRWRAAARALPADGATGGPRATR